MNLETDQNSFFKNVPRHIMHVQFLTGSMLYVRTPKW
jgi:hypothetical protein